MTVTETIQNKLSKAFPGAEVTVKDESHLHAGHAGAREGGESHFRVCVISQTFDGMNRVARQRAINQALAEELAGPIHALAMKALTPDEAD